MSGPPPGRLRPTGAPALAVAALAGVLVGGAVVPLVRAAGGIVPRVPWVTVLTLVFLAVLLLSLAWTTARTVRRSPGSGGRRLEPHRAVNLLVLGMASALVGAAVFGGYLAFGLSYLGDDSTLGRERLLHGLLAAAAAVLVVTGGLLLERACQVPRRPGDDDPDRPD